MGRCSWHCVVCVQCVVWPHYGPGHTHQGFFVASSASFALPAAHLQAMVLAAPGSITQLPSKEVNSLRSDCIISSLAVAVEELVANSLDAGATSVQASPILLSWPRCMGGCEAV